MNLKLNIACDDVNPHPKYRLLGTPAEKWFRQLNDEFGVKFTLFVPSNYHHQFPLSDHKNWIDELINDPKFELAHHGHFHQTSDPRRFGEAEFAELNFDQTTERLEKSFEEWDAVDYIPETFRPPGWLVSKDANDAINSYQIRKDLWDYPWFSRVAVHYDHNNGLKWNSHTFFGHDGIQQENISIHNGDMIMFQSHIYGNHNHNVWNEQNYEQLRLSLTHLFENYQITPITLKEAI